MQNYTYIDTQADFERLCDELAKQSMLAMDTEFVRRNTYYPILALIQIAAGGQISLIDPEGVTDWTPLIGIFESDVCIVMHSCSEDLEVFRHALGVLPSNLFDTQIAAAYLGKGDALGYAAMVSLMCNEEVDKSETQSDWSQRPLSDAQLAYAAADVIWLEQIAHELSEELDSRDRQNWVSEEVNSLLNKSSSEMPANQTWLKLKGLGKIQPQDWPLAIHLCAWREETARRRNKPKSWILKDPEILEIIQHKPSDLTELSNLSAIAPQTTRYNGKKIIELLQNVDNLPEPEQQPAPDLTGSERKILKAMQKVVTEYAEKEGLAQRFIANKQELSHFILRHHERYEYSSPLDKGWRKRAVADQLMAVFSA